MSPDKSRLVVIRAWRDGSVLRVRILFDDDRRQGWVVTGAAAAAAAVQQLLSELEPAADDRPDARRGR